MQPWQIVDFEGCLYYAFLPSKHLSKLVKEEISDPESQSAMKSSKSIAENGESEENSTRVLMGNIIGNELEELEDDLERQIKHEIENEMENKVNPEEEEEIDDEIENELAAMEHENDYGETESHLDLNYDAVALMQEEEEENGEIEKVFPPEEMYEVELKNEEMLPDDLPEDIVVQYNEGTKFYVCLECDFYFTHLEDYRKHMNQLHEQAQRFKCKICFKICRNLRSFKVHVETEHKESQQKLDSLTYNCSYCSYTSTNRSTLNSHVSRKHLNPKSTGNVTCRRTTPGEELACDACDFKCPNKRRLKEHLERRHAIDFKYECDYCAKKFKVKGDMRLHVRFKHKEGPIVCDVCGKTCSNSNSLYVHQKWAHYKPKFECEICHRRMVTQENLDQHILLQHERRESFVCEECGKSFLENHRLKQHMMTHTGDRPYDCHICGKAFARRTSYRQHLLIHTGKRPYICDICGKAFTQKPGLICHRKSHPGVHPPLPVVHIDHILNDFMKKE